jgi:DNA-binding GntR family transcriptional regulator
MSRLRQEANLLAERTYRRLKAEIFDFKLLPGDRFTETEMATRYKVSRTPVRDALYRLEREGYLQVAFRSGWSVRPLDFDRFEQLYDLRTVLETEAIGRLCRDPEARGRLEALAEIWNVPPEGRIDDARAVGALDEAFHGTIVEAAGNPEMAAVHRAITEKIRIVRRLDFTAPYRVAATYDEHAEILRLVVARKTAQASALLRSHIEQSRQEVRKITLQMLQAARERLAGPASRARR